jgi:hypothetical protein
MVGPTAFTTPFIQSPAAKTIAPTATTAFSKATLKTSLDIRPIARSTGVFGLLYMLVGSLEGGRDLKRTYANALMQSDAKAQSPCPMKAIR